MFNIIIKEKRQSIPSDKLTRRLHGAVEQKQHTVVGVELKWDYGERERDCYAQTRHIQLEDNSNMPEYLI